MNIIEQYKTLNESFKKSCVFHIGIDAGFFSEFNYLVFTILYCLENKITLKLYSKDANFGYNKGWTDFFLPFTEEMNETFHSFLNRHPTGFSLKQILQSKNFDLLKWKIKNEGWILVAKYFKYLFQKNKFDYYTQDILSLIGDKNKRYNIENFISGDYINAYNKVFDLLWRFNTETQYSIDQLIHNLNLPDQYIGCQIRGGDKFIEYDLLSEDIYLSKIKEISTLKDVFVLTDDYRIIERLKSKAPEYNWYTLCNKDQQGYYNTKFSKSDPKIKKTQMTALFASVELLCKSTVFIGTITATPCGVVGIRKYPNAHWVDFNEDLFYNSIDFSIENKNILVKKFFEGK